MNFSARNNTRGLRPLKLPAREVPHVVIEPNLTCNMRCRRCYNLHHDVVKTFEQIAGEIDYAVDRRNLETVSLLGGEPTLHPDIVRIVEYVKKRKLICQILTNGLLFYNDPQSDLLNRLVSAGTDRIVLHADEGQQRPAGVNCDEFREALFDRFERRAVFFGLSITVYPESRRRVAEIMKRFARYRFFDGILVTIAGDGRTSVLGSPHGDDEPCMREEHDSIVEGLAIQPSTYIPSSIDDSDARWLMYFYYINYRTGATFSLSPLFGRIFRKAYRFLFGRQFFAKTLNPRFFAIGFMCTAFVEIVLNPIRLRSLLRLMKGCRRLDGLRFHYVVMQSAPQRSEESGRIGICYHCPDATIRSGKLTPVCIADRINPLPFDRYADEVDRQLGAIVYEHLEEALP